MNKTRHKTELQTENRDERKELKMDFIEDTSSARDERVFLSSLPLLYYIIRIFRYILVVYLFSSMFLFCLCASLFADARCWRVSASVVNNDDGYVRCTTQKWNEEYNDLERSTITILLTMVCPFRFVQKLRARARAQLFSSLP